MSKRKDPYDMLSEDLHCPKCDCEDGDDCYADCDCNCCN